ncbi:hypothetical protein AN641_08580 [Candidatus Epulonipiscioides gigas]|nr:hypothetical protein AN641_08580 [Epulopiscium sp. SCG-C07WGA-EpuloA2]
MKLLKKKSIWIAATVALAVTIPVFAAGNFQTLEAYYNNIRVTVNDEYKTLKHEPFIVDGVTYVGVRDIGSLFNISANWNVMTQTVELTGGLSSQEALMYTQQITALQAELEDVTNKLTQYQQSSSGNYNSNSNSQSSNPWNNSSSNTWNSNQSSSNTQYDTNGFLLVDVDDIEDMLHDEYEDYEDVEWTFSLSPKSSYIKFDIEFDGDDYLDDYEDISSSKLERFIEDMCDDIMAELEGSIYERHDIEGDIHDADNDEDLWSFEYTDGDIEAEENEAFPNLDELEDLILDDIITDDYDDVFEIDPPNSDDDIEIDIDDVTLEVNDDEDAVIFTVDIDFDSGEQTHWDELFDLLDKIPEAEDLMEDIEKEIEDEYNIDRTDDEIIGYLKDGSTTLIEYDDKGFDYK